MVKLSPSNMALALKLSQIGQILLFARYLQAIAARPTKPMGNATITVEKCRKGLATGHKQAFKTP